MPQSAIIDVNVGFRNILISTTNAFFMSEIKKPEEFRTYAEYNQVRCSRIHDISKKDYSLAAAFHYLLEVGPSGLKSIL